DMTAWMEYVTQQKPMPGKVGGVNVELYAIDENGQTTYIDTVCTDPLNGGVFRKLWTPPKEGTYIITAVFAGTKSYWDSYASTCVGVTAAPPAPAAPETETQPTDYTPMLNTLMIVVAVVGVIAVIDLIINIYMSRKLRKQ
ncbi:MAG: hypothetical protein QXE16_05010, partial [Candidatus Bathyarchaeia archaeon]